MQRRHFQQQKEVETCTRYETLVLSLSEKYQEDTKQINNLNKWALIYNFNFSVNKMDGNIYLHVQHKLWKWNKVVWVAMPIMVHCTIITSLSLCMEHMK
jgi:hypothetical protein